MQNVLSGVEYLLICMQSNPGKPQAYYLKRLTIYKLGLRKFLALGSPANRNVSYFNRTSKYRNNLWSDLGKQEVKYDTAFGVKLKPKKSQMYLTTKGWNRANEARKKIGLAPFEKN
jgi:hypothetical protein